MWELLRASGSFWELVGDSETQTGRQTDKLTGRQNVQLQSSSPRSIAWIFLVASCMANLQQENEGCPTGNYGCHRRRRTASLGYSWWSYAWRISNKRTRAARRVTMRSRTAVLSLWLQHNAAGFGAISALARQTLNPFLNRLVYGFFPFLPPSRPDGSCGPWPRCPQCY